MNTSDRWTKIPGNYDTMNLAYLYKSTSDNGIPDFPQIDVRRPPEDLFSYSDINKCKDPKNNGLHFFIDDYRFEPLWTRPIKTLDKIKKFGVVLSPDFSLYSEFPLVAQMWNVYRSRWLANYWYENNISVIPTLMWGDERTYDFCFNGIPKHSIYALSMVGAKKNIEGYSSGLIEALNRLEPTTLLVYGNIPEELKHLFSGIGILQYHTYFEKRGGII